MKSLAKIHESCKQIFLDNLLDKEGGGYSNACNMYQVMTDGREECENCIGENFNQLIQRVITDWFGCYTPSGNIDYYFFNYCILLYLFVERVDFIFDVLNKDGKSKLLNDFQHNNFQALRKINKWANFVKHPKEFLFTHWATYYFEGNPPVNIGKGDVLINTQFIFEHYFSETKPRPTILENNHRVFVEIPDLEVLTNDFCKELNVFFDFVCENKIIHDFLRKKSTIEHYYETE